MQLMQPSVQKCTTTTCPWSDASVSGSLWSHSVPGANSGAPVPASAGKSAIAFALATAGASAGVDASAPARGIGRRLATATAIVTRATRPIATMVLRMRHPFSVGDQIDSESQTRVPVVAPAGPVVGGAFVLKANEADALEALVAVLDRQV